MYLFSIIEFSKKSKMKNLILGILSVFLAVTMVQAQNGKRALSEAKKAFGIYNLDTQNKGAKLQQALEKLKIAEADRETNSLAKTWLLKGDVCNEVANQQVAARQLNLSVKGVPKVRNAAELAFEAYSKALELSQKKYELKDALKGIRSVQYHLYKIGIFTYEDSNYDAAYHKFSKTIDAHKILQKNQTKSFLDAEENYNQHLYMTGLAALNAQMETQAASLFEELYNKNYDKPAVYEALYKIHAKADIEQAYTYLEKGRSIYPDDVSLLFAEINHFLRINELDVLINKIYLAIDKEPENMTLYTTLGNVYDNLYQRESSAGNEVKAQEHFNNALKYYQHAIDKRPDYFDAIYSVGALYFNKAAAKTKGLIELSDDLSQEGLKKYDLKKEEIFGIFDKALPYFKKAESLNPNDINTLMALKEIFARKDDLGTSMEFKNRLTKVQNGQSNDSSYFKE